MVEASGVTQNTVSQEGLIRNGHRRVWTRSRRHFAAHQSSLDEGAMQYLRCFVDAAQKRDLCCIYRGSGSHILQPVMVRCTSAQRAYGGACEKEARDAAGKLLKQFAGLGHVLPIKAANVEILKSPTDFFNAMMKGVNQATSRLTIASLYIGTGAGYSHDFVNALSHVANASADRPDLRITILLDGARGTRSSLGPDGFSTNSAEHLRKSLFKSEASKERARLLLYQTPALQGLIKKVLPPRVREVVSVCHLKIYLFDDDILLTGANLSNDYFSHRQDRYILIRNTKVLADKLDHLAQAMGDFSLQLSPCGELHSPSSGIHPTNQPAQFRYSLWKRITELMYPLHSPLYSWWGRQASQRMQTNLKPSQESGILEESEDTWVIPAVQIAHFHIRQDEICTLRCLEATEPGGNLQLASAYLNLASPFERALIRSPSLNLDILTASPRANGFYGAKGLSGFVPTAYSLVMGRLWQKLCNTKGSGRGSSTKRQILEYCRDKWQFHAKGIWYAPPQHTQPVLTAIGSPNFGHRSVYRDVEAQVFLITANRALRNELYHELHNLKGYCHPVQEESVRKLKEQTGPAAHLAVKLLQGFL